LIQLARLAVLRRPGYEPDWPTLDRDLPQLRACIDWIDHAEINISASNIRRRLQQGLSVETLVSPEVIEFIRAHHLYQPQ
jgi:nicotinate-nucleotide adenylyltransferase